MLSSFTSTFDFFFYPFFAYATAFASFFWDFSIALVVSFVNAFYLSAFYFFDFNAFVSCDPDCPSVPLAFCSLYFFLSSLISSESESDSYSWLLTFFLLPVFLSSSCTDFASSASDFADFLSFFCLRLCYSFLFSYYSATSLRESIM